MRILLLNPNTTQALSELLLAEGQKLAGSDTELIPATAPRGFPYIGTQAEAQVGGAIALEMLAEHVGAIDGAIIAAFGDPGLIAARELFDFPVVGMAEAAMLTACMAGRRFGIICFSRELAGWYADTARLYGLSERCAGVFPLEVNVKSVVDVRVEQEQALLTVADRAVAAGADVLIFAGAPLSGLAERVADRLPVPAIEQVGAAVRQVETLVRLRERLGTPKQKVRVAKETAGLSAALAARFKGD